MKIFAETKRLILREIIAEDYAGLYEMDSDPAVHRYLGNKPLTDIGQAKKVIEFIRQQYADNGIGRWAVTDKFTGAFLGWSGLKLMTEPVNGHVNFYDLGYRFKKKYWGNGYATETAKASVAYAFNKLKATELYGIADCENNNSRNVLMKAGLKYIETFQFDNVPHDWFKLSKKDMIIREATIEDIPEIQRVRNSVKENMLSDPALVPDSDVADFMFRRGKGWVCETEGRIAGFAVADLVENNIWALFIDPDFEKRGIGQKLHDAMMDWYFAQGKEHVWLGTAPGTRAQRFYRKAGWQENGMHGSKEVKFEMTKENWSEIQSTKK